MIYIFIKRTHVLPFRRCAMKRSTVIRSAKSNDIRMGTHNYRKESSQNVPKSKRHNTKRITDNPPQNQLGPCESEGAKIRNRYNQVSHLTQDTNGKVINSQLDTSNESQEVSPFPACVHKADAHKVIANARQINIKDPQKKYCLGWVSKIFSVSAGYSKHLWKSITWNARENGINF